MNWGTLPRQPALYCKLLCFTSCLLFLIPSTSLERPPITCWLRRTCYTIYFIISKLLVQTSAVLGSTHIFQKIIITVTKPSARYFLNIFCQLFWSSSILFLIIGAFLGVVRIKNYTLMNCRYCFALRCTTTDTCNKEWQLIFHFYLYWEATASYTLAYNDSHTWWTAYI